MITHSNTVRNLITGSPKRNKTIAAIAVVILASIIMIFLLIQGSDKLKLEVTVTLDGKPLAETHVEILDSKIKPLVTDKTGKCLFDNLNFQNKEKIRILVNVDEHTHKLKTHVIDAGIDINKVKIFIGQESTYLILNTLHDNISWEIYDTQNSTHIQSGTGSDKIEIPQNKSIDLIYMLRGIDESKFEKRHDIKTGPIIDNLKIYKLEIIPENEFLIYTLKDVNNGEIYAESNGHKLFYFDKENSIIIQYLTLDGEMIEDIRLNDTNYSKRVNLKGNPPEDDSNYYVTIKVSPNSAEWKVIDRKNNSTQNEGYGQQTIQLARGSYLIKEKCDHGDCKEKEFVISNSDKTIDFNLRSFTLNIFTSPTDKPWELITPAGTKITGTTPMIIDREITRGKYRARAKRANGDWTSWIRKTVDRSDITIKIDVSLPCLRPKLYINVIPPDISWKIEKKIKFPGDWITFYSGVGNDAIDVKNDQTYRVSVKVKDNEKLSDLFVFSHVHETCVENVTFDFTDCNNQIYVSLGDDERLAELADSCYTGDFVLECDYFLPLAESYYRQGEFEKAFNFIEKGYKLSEGTGRCLSFPSDEGYVYEYIRYAEKLNFVQVSSTLKNALEEDIPSNISGSPVTLIYAKFALGVITFNNIERSYNNYSGPLFNKRDAFCDDLDVNKKDLFQYVIDESDYHSIIRWTKRSNNYLARIESFQNTLSCDVP